MTLPATRPPATLEAAVELLSTAPTEVARGHAFTRVGREPGSAPTVLLVHGVGASRAVWAPILPSLASRYDVLVVDLPGHGASDPLPESADARCRALARQLAAACAELGVVRPHVVGNSLGGWVGLEMAADGNAATLTALAPAGLRLVPGPPNRLLYLNRRLARLTGPVADPLLGFGWVRELTMASGTTRPRDLHPAIARATVRALRASTAYERILDATRHVRFDRRAELVVPLTVAFGDTDRILPRPNQRRELVPDDARWVVLPRCGHAPMWDSPDETITLIDETVATG